MESLPEQERIEVVFCILLPQFLLCFLSLDASWQIQLYSDSYLNLTLCTAGLQGFFAGTPAG